MVGRHPSMIALYDRMSRVAGSSLNVLVVGETGTGKELVARGIHALSPRAAEQLVALNSAAVPEGIAEAELFGVEPGAFTGAVRRRLGHFARAHRGTLFLDELDSATPGFQARLLRAVEHGEFTRVGGTRPEVADVRLVGAVSEAPDALVAAGRLRRDLYHRLAGCRLYLPPLRERREDIVLLAEHFLGAPENHGRVRKRLDPSAVRALQDHDWPGNVRELKSVMHALIALRDDGWLTEADVMAEINGGVRTASERERLVAVLETHQWNARRAALAFGCSRATLYRLLRRHGVDRPTGECLT
jgi:DNA-binding NtrC family response regulator